MTTLQQARGMGPIALPDGWVRHVAALGIVAALILAIFFRDAADMAAIWWTSSTFNHCLLILPLLGWLVWQRRAELADLTPQTSLLGLAIVGAGATGWLLGEAAAVALARHLGLVLMLQGSVVAVLGTTVARGLLFPLFYMFFLVPVGEEFVPALQLITADLSMILLNLSGLPAHIEGVFITTPSGYFEVAEACSGVMFLIAMVALGALMANLCFSTWPRRIGFMALCVAVPIIANGIRAFGTIYIADSSGIGFAESFDHVVYGWFFFALVIAIVMAIGWRFIDRELDEPAFDPRQLQSGSVAQDATSRIGIVSGLALIIALLPVAWSAAMAQSGEAPVPTDFAAPSIEGWETMSQRSNTEWTATYDGADAIVTARYRHRDHTPIDLAIGYFSDQDEGRELVGFGQGGLPAESAWSWVDDSAPVEGGHAYRITAPGPVNREVVDSYVVGDAPATGSANRAKLTTLRTRLMGGSRRAIGITISAEGRDARAAIDAFLADSGGIMGLVDRVPGLAD